MWECKCDCGNHITVRSTSLKNGLTKSCGCLRSEMLSGENSKFWKGGVTDINIKFRRNGIFQTWSKKIKKRDNYTCQKCGSKDNLNAHHIINVSYDRNKSFDLDNGITFCEECHKKFHKKYGKKINNKQQINEFLNEKLGD